MIHDLLYILRNHQGKDNPISADDLLVGMRNFGYEISGLPELRELIHDARLLHHLICSSGRGYFIPTTLNEALAFVEDKLRDPARDLMHTARVVRQAAREHFGGQLRML